METAARVYGIVSLVGYVVYALYARPWKGRQMSSQPMSYEQTRGYCEPCLYFSACPTHDPDGSAWRAKQHPGTPYYDDEGRLHHT